MTDDTTVAASVVTAIGFDINYLLEHLKAVPDPRKARGKRYALSFLLGVIILAKPAGQHKPAAVVQNLAFAQRSFEAELALALA